MKSNLILFLILSCVVFSFLQCQSNDGSTQYTVEWRYDRTGIYSREVGLLKSWPEDGPELLWYNDELGDGYSSVSIDYNRLFVSGCVDDKGYLYVLNMEGKLLNKIEYGIEFTERYPGPRSTVIPNDGKLYIVSGMMELFCFDMHSLKLLWKKNYAQDYEAQNTLFGWLGSPLIVDEKLIIAPGGKQYHVVALNKSTGDLIWSSEGARETDISGYGTPIYIGDQEVPQVVISMSEHIIGVDISNGKLLWAYEHFNDMREHPNTPVYSNNMLLFSYSDDGGSLMLRLINGGRNVEKVWHNAILNPVMGHVIKYGNYVYGPGEKMYWHCLDWQTGEVTYSDRTLPIGSIIAADEMIYIYTEKADGEMVLVKPNHEKFEIISRFNVTLGTELHLSHPVIYKGVLYIRHGNTLMAYKIRGA